MHEEEFLHNLIKPQEGDQYGYPIFFIFSSWSQIPSLQSVKIGGWSTCNIDCFLSKVNGKLNKTKPLKTLVYRVTQCDWNECQNFSCAWTDQKLVSNKLLKSMPAEATVIIDASGV